MWWWRRDVTIAIQCAEASFSLAGKDKAKFIEGVETFKYLGLLLNRLYDNWPAVRWNFSKARQVWIWLGKILRREGADQLVSAMFYWEVVQAVLLFGS